MAAKKAAAKKPAKKAPAKAEEPEASPSPPDSVKLSPIMHSVTSASLNPAFHDKVD